MISLLAVAFLAGTPAMTSPGSGFAGDLTGTWVYEDGEQHLSISVDADGRCSVVGRSKLGGKVVRVTGGYWVHGSRIYLRARRETSGERPVLEVEHDRQLDELIFHGDTELTFTRRALEERRE